MDTRRATTGARCVLIAIVWLLVGCQRSLGVDDAVRHVVGRAARPTLTAFGSEEELAAFLRALRRSRRGESYGALMPEIMMCGGGCGSEGASCSGGKPCCPGLSCVGGTCSSGPSMEDAPAAAEEAESPAPAPADESITNVQHAGVDEGGIVKLHGDHLVILRRGRLFSVYVGSGKLTPVSAVDAFGPDIDPDGTWYDELLVYDDTVVVIGYSYARGGLDVGLFDFRGGRFRYRATYTLRANDYYSSRNYASRLIGSKLIFYTPLALYVEDDDLYGSFPALRKWEKGATKRDFRRIAPARRIYRPIMELSFIALHTVTICDLAAAELSCNATSVMGPPGRVFYVSPSSVFVWVTDWQTKGSVVYRLALDGSPPTALDVKGSPVDQFSFLESDDDHLNVVLRAEAVGDGMWDSEISAGEVAMLRVPLASFSADVHEAPASRYRELPKPHGATFQNRFVGSHLLYGTGSGWGARQVSEGTLTIYPYAGGKEPVTLSLGHGVDRIEALGSDALVVGADERDVHFSPVALDGPHVATRYTRRDAAQGELRSHGFFYKADDDRTGVIGLPIREAGRPGFEHLFHDSASVLFVKNDALRLRELGTLVSQPERASDDACRASCVDWYGNARPLFLKQRVFALLGYEIVEGELKGTRIRERRRASFAPR